MALGYVHVYLRMYVYMLYSLLFSTSHSGAVRFASWVNNIPLCSEGANKTICATTRGQSCNISVSIHNATIVIRIALFNMSMYRRIYKWTISSVPNLYHPYLIIPQLHFGRELMMQ